MARFRLSFGLVLLPLFLPVTALDAATTVRAAFAPPPLAFVPNRGQFDPRIRFAAHDSRSMILVTDDGMVVEMPHRHAPADVVRMQLDGVAGSGAFTAADELPWKTNYYRGADPSKWRENVPAYSKAILRNAWPGIDVVYHATDAGQPEFDFLLSPGATASEVRFSSHGPKRPTLDSRGAIAVGDLRLAPDVAYQDIAGERKVVEARFVRRGRSFGVDVRAYDKRLPLVIDPSLFFGTYLGGSDIEMPRDLAVDPYGNTVVTGLTASPDFPWKTGAPRSGSYDVFVTEYDLTGHVVFSTLLGGTSSTSPDEVAGGVATDSHGNVYITGTTASANFPVLNALYPTCPSCPNDAAFVSKLNRNGTLQYSTYLGSTQRTEGRDIAVDPTGDAYVLGRTVEGAADGRAGFPLVNAYQSAALATTGCCSTSMFLTRLNPSGSAIVYSTLFGSDSSGVLTHEQSVAVDGTGRVWITGDAEEQSGSQYPGGFTYPTTPGAIRSDIQADGNPHRDAFVAEFDTIGSGAPSLVYSTLVGGATGDEYVGLAALGEMAYPHDSIAVDRDGNAYLIGTTYSTDFPTTSGVIGPTLTGGNTTDWFISKINGTGTGFVYSTYYGSPNGGSDEGMGIAIDSAGDAYVVGKMVPGTPTVKELPNQPTSGVPGYIAILNPTATAVIFSSYLDLDEARAVDIDFCGNPYVLGLTGLSQTGAALLKNPAQPTPGGNADAFVMRLDLNAGDVNHDCAVNVNDVFYLINYLFMNGTQPLGTADVNDDGTVGIGDVFYLIRYLFANGPKPVGNF